MLLRDFQLTSVVPYSEPLFEVASLVDGVDLTVQPVNNLCGGFKSWPI